MEALLQELQNAFDTSEQGAWNALHARNYILYHELRGRVSGLAFAMNRIRDILDK